MDLVALTPYLERTPNPSPMPNLLRTSVRWLLLSAGAAAPVTGQTRPDHGTLVVVVGQEATLPIPTLVSGRADADVASLLFLHLAELVPGQPTSGDEGFAPRLARSWTRRDSLTLAVDLDPRARWHDGTPVTARDVAFTFDRFRNPAVAPQEAFILRYLAAATAEGDHRVVFRFRRWYAEQLYDLIQHVAPLPAHLVDTIPPERFAQSEFARAPVGNGPYRWVRRTPGRMIELRADSSFFLQAPHVDRVVFLLARDPEAQLNLLLDGTADALQNVAPSALPRIRAQGRLAVVPVPTLSVGYLTLNLRAPGDSIRPHPILGDRDVRRALAMALDRETMVRAVLGDFGTVPEGPVAQRHWFRSTATGPIPYDPAGARRLLDRRGWRDTDGDGVRDRNGIPFRLTLIFPGTNVVRATMAPLIQEQLRQIGIQIDLVRLDGPVWLERHDRGAFDIDFSQASYDPSPMALNQAWRCEARGGVNVGGYCNPAVDTALEQVSTAPHATAAMWQRPIRMIVEDAPAIFLYGLTNAAVVHDRFARTPFPPTAYWSDVWRWTVKPGRQIPRDREPGPR